ncbi:MAG: hypothetical protein AB7I27_19140 [Bacteriovoracaceae bacterium]
MATIFDEVLYYSTRLKTVVSFTNSVNEKETRDFFGSGVWIASPRGGKHIFFVTNRHLVDYEYGKWRTEGAEGIINIDIELRKFNERSPLPEAAFFDIVSVQNKIFYPQDGSDLAIIAISINLTALKEAGTKGFRPLCLAMDTFIANKSYFDNDLKAIDAVTFIGFPKGDYDLNYNLPIARNANIASDPRNYFKNNWIEGDLVLVSGLSFGGSSGSPVYSLPVGSEGLGFGRVLKPRLIGIISGHLIDENRKHKGLSYLVKSTKILEVLQENGLLI